MNIEEEIFKRTRLNIDALIPYGFVKNKNVYEYSKIFMNSFRADIVIDEQGKVTGKVNDLNTDDEYINFRIENQVGKFVSSVREEYKNILKDIKEHCFGNLYFITEQANRIAERIVETYHNEPEFPWEKFKGYGVFKNPKWSM